MPAAFCALGSKKEDDDPVSYETSLARDSWHGPGVVDFRDWSIFFFFFLVAALVCFEIARLYLLAHATRAMY